MLVKLNGQSTATPMTWNTDANIPSISEVGTIMGYGATSSGPNSEDSDVLLKVDLQHVGFDTCKIVTDQTDPRIDLVDNIMICHDGVLPNTDSCGGDSGGPLVRASDNNVIVGIASFATTATAICAQDGQYAIHARVR